MKRVWLRSLLFVAVVCGVGGLASTANAQWGYGGYGGFGYGYAAPVVVVPQPYIAYSNPLIYGGYGYGGYAGYGYGGGLVIRDRYNIGLFGHPHYHRHVHPYHHHHRYGW